MTINVDDVLTEFKIFGRYYTTFSIISIYTIACTVMHANNYIFATMKVRYSCLDERFKNNSCASLSNTTGSCTEWMYDDPYSFVAEFQLACQEWKRTLVGTITGLGYMIGLLLVGPLSDRLGRKTTMIVNGVVNGLFGIIKSFTTYYWVYIVLEFLQSGFGNYSSPNYTMVIELPSHDKRLKYQMIAQFGCSLAFLILALLAWSVSYWRHVLLIIYILPVFFICFIFIMDENPRWLLSKGQKEKAIVTLEKMAKIDKLDLGDKDLQNLSHEDIKRVKFTKVLKDTMTSKILIKRFLICVTWWITCTFVNYGMQINSVSLRGNMYVNFSYLAVTELLGNIVATYCLIRFKRKKPLACSFLITALMCLFQPFTPKCLPWLSVLLYMSAKLMSVIFFNITYVYTSELFPTYTRNSMHALCSSLGRIGSIIAPQTPLLMTYWEGLPSLVFGAVALIAGLVTLLAPNTSDAALPDNVHQAEAIGQKQLTISQYEGKRSYRKRERNENQEHRF